MFEDSLIESGGRRGSKRVGTTIFSFTLEFLFIGILILMPLIYTDALPKSMTMTFLVAPAPPPPPPPPPAVAPVRAVRIQTEITNGQLRAPSRIPDKIQMIREDDTPPDMGGGVPGGVPGGIPGGQTGGVIGGILNATHMSTPTIAVPVRQRVSTGVMTGLLIRKIQPNYPPLAKAARIQGQVVLQAQISKDGTIENLQLISGHPMLAPAAIEAVKQWRYRPYLLNGEPVAVDTQVIVNFNLSGG